MNRLSVNLFSGDLGVSVPIRIPKTLFRMWRATARGLCSRAFKLIREQVERFVRGEPLINIVTGEY
jgi:hypothetical protein